MIEPDDELRARIHAWAKKKRLNLDALEVAACKLRDPNRMLRTLSDPEVLNAAFPASTSVPLTRQVDRLPNSRQQHFKRCQQCTSLRMVLTTGAIMQHEGRLRSMCTTCLADVTICLQQIAAVPAILQWQIESACFLYMHYSSTCWHILSSEECCCLLSRHLFGIKNLLTMLRCWVQELPATAQEVVQDHNQTHVIYTGSEARRGRMPPTALLRQRKGATSAPAQRERAPLHPLRCLMRPQRCHSWAVQQQAPAQLKRSSEGGPLKKRALQS